MISNALVDMRKFIDDLYTLNPDVLPPKEMVTDITLNVVPGSPLTFVVTIVGLTMPSLGPDDAS